MTGLRITAMTLLAFALAGCAGGMGSLSDPPTPKVTMAGRWLLSAPNSPSCGMNFAQPPNSVEGTIAPEGGCPGNFFTSRQWAFEQGDLAVRDHNSELLAQLKFVDNRFEGKSVAGLPVTLTRSGPPAQ